ncbi:amidohydrolase [candidate division KSB1 bacterium]
MNNRRLINICLVFPVFFLSLTGLIVSDNPAGEKQAAFEWIDTNAEFITGLSDKIWEYAELPMEEYQSSRLLADALEQQGFSVERDIAGMPTAFIASYGSGEPIMGFLAEYDALPGLSQKKLPYKEPLVIDGDGHGCGHNLLGVGGTAGAMAVRHIMEEFNLKGTVRLYGCPNEENDIGKVFMAKEGLFNDLSAVVDWHPSSVTQVALGGSHAIHNFLVTYRGKTAHAGGDPWNGISALDGLECMNIMVNYLREHVKPTVRIQYAVIEGGKVANVVPDYAVAWYNTRDVTIEGSEEVFNKVKRIAEASAMATGTQVEIKMLTAIHQLVVLPKSSEIMQKNLELVGPPDFTPEDYEFAREVQRSLEIEEEGLFDEVRPLTPERPGGFGGGGTDVAEVSWNTPVLRLNVTTNPLGSPGHSWAVVCTGSHPIGHKGMLTAAKVMAATIIDLMTQPELLASVRSEWKEKTEGKPYKSPLPPDAVPPVVPEKKKGGIQ